MTGNALSSFWASCRHSWTTAVLLLALTAVTLRAEAQVPDAAPGTAAPAPPPPTDPVVAPPDGEPTVAPETPELAAEAPAATAVPANPPAAAGETTGTVPVAAADEAADLAAELAAAEAVAEAGAIVPRLNIYGFADFTYARRLTSDDGNFVGQRLPSFYVGNFNIYLDGQLGQWRSLAEARLTYLPDGAGVFDPATGQQSRVSSSYPDYADYYRPRKVGGVIIERVWLEYAAHPLLTIRAGQFLTPYGIWNVDHGSPVVIGVTRPYIVGNEWLPARQTGLEIHGTHGIESTQFGYHLTLSNGRGPIDSYEDLDENKAVGWRLWVRNDSPVGTFTFGTSGYRGKYTDTVAESQITPDSYSTTYRPVLAYDELGLALDFKWTWGGYLLQSELILHDVKYDDRARAAAPFPTPVRGWAPDERVWGYYAITGYRFPWLGVMPFVGNQYLYAGKGNPFTCWEFNGGLNIRPNEIAVLKLVALWVWRPEPLVFSKAEGQFLAQAAWSF